jgi:broad specificity phosphatase PhoE
VIYLVRHGEAAAGWGEAAADPGLSVIGVEQARQVASHLQGIGARGAITSPMRRCQETAAPFADMNASQLLIEPAVSEIAAPKDAPDRVAWLRGIMAGTWAEAGETYVAWRRAMAGRIESLREDTVVFTHFVAINALAGYFEGDDRVTLFRPGHCSVTRLERRSGRLCVADWGREASTRVL